MRDSKTESLVNVQKIIKETNDQIATKPALVLAAVSGSSSFSNFLHIHAVRHVRVAICRTTDIIGSPNQQQ